MMRQITDPRAPFASIDDALTAGEEHLRRLGWSLVGMAAVEQPGGYFVRISGLLQPDRGRGSRNKRQNAVVEVGKITEEKGTS